MDLLQDLFLAPESNRCSSGYPWPELRAQPFCILWQLGSRTYEAHIAAQNIVELRQFIELEFSQPANHCCNTVIAISSKTHRVARTQGHAAKLVNAEQAAVESDTLLNKHRWPFGGDANERGNEKHGKRKETEY